ncbi:ArnT family glycosyltransferase [Shewanella fodinae]|uniref:ArnT family glycosyltransferase n=1 Tax=Shewanella fodinae TaxID=552357 RepID=UPI001679DC6C|nr:glycosyltransferase family 39 protein [Shewanella fodinae]MCL2906660.1 glycosyltransferase family 39 protein [Shewanella fodinae]GGZ03394.1 glycosyl transferase [Shewanella fodinae]
MNFLLKPFDSDDYRRVFWALFWLTLVVMLLGIGFRSPWPADEPRFVEAAREMVSNGQWLFPSRGGEFYPDKPPVFMWAIALCYLLLGNLKLAFLLPNALCGLLTVMLVFDLGARLWNVRIGRNAALLLMLVPQFLVQTKNAQIDAMVMCWITVGCYGLVRHFMVGPNWRWYFVSWAFMGLGVITKGVGFLPLLMLIPLAVYAWRQKLYLPSWKWKAALGPLVMLAVIAAWLVPMVLTVLHNGSPEYTAYMNNILFKQTGHRYANAWHHIKPWYFFIVSVIPWLWFPLPFLAIAHWKTFVSRLKLDPQIAILLLWVALVIVFFSISPGKRNLYILPALPMAALAMAAALQGVDRKRWFEWLVSGLMWLVTVVTLVLGGLAVAESPWLLDKLADYTDNLARFGYFLLSMGLLFALVLLVTRRSFSLIRAGVMTFIGWVLYASWGYLLLDSVRTPKAVLQHTAEVIGADAQLGLIHFKEQFILFSPLDITHFSYLAPVAEQERNAWRWMQQGTQHYLLVPGGDKLQCFDMSKGRNMGTAHREDWYLLGPDAMNASCPEPEQVEVYHTERPGQWMRE